MSWGRFAAAMLFMVIMHGISLVVALVIGGDSAAAVAGAALAIACMSWVRGMKA